MSKIRWAQATLLALAAFIFIGCGGGGGGGGTSTTGLTTSGTTGTVAVAVTPPDAADVINGPRTFAATVTGNANTAVTWSVVGGSANGSITQNGVYTAPATPGTYTVMATSNADPTKNAQVQVVVGTAAFIHTSDLPGGIFSSGIQGLSANGSTAVGFGTPTPPSGQAPANNAILWQDNGGIAALTNVGPGVAYASNSAGTTIVGVRQLTNITAFTYSGGVVTELPNLPGGTGASAAFGVSGNGSVIVGQASTSTSATHATKWIAGAATDLGTLTGGSFSLARAISVDGNVIVGESGQTIGARAVRWVGGGAPSSLGVFTGGTESLANGTNGDGSVIIGESGSNVGGTHTAAFRWTSGGGLVDLGNLGGSSLNARAFAVSSDGTIVVGESQTGVGVGNTEAFIWTQGTGMQKLQTVLQSKGMTVPLTGWTLLSATCISQDGKVIGGLGTNPLGKPEGWVAILP